MRLAEAERFGLDKRIVLKAWILEFSVEWARECDTFATQFCLCRRQEFPFRGALRRPEPGEPDVWWRRILVVVFVQEIAA
jgi:hypothetical protein